jgi:predicted nucleotide-binding protein (sugar kinase/HSP70/actin superfamily)
MRHILDQHGLGAVEVLSPTADNSYHGFGDNPGALRRLAWQGIVALDLQHALLHRFRPYAVDPAAAEAIYAEGLARTADALRRRGKGLAGIVRWCADELAALPQTPQPPRPVIGLIGEIYLRFSGYANQRLTRMVEDLGGEVIVATMMEWLYYTNWWHIYKAKAHHKVRARLVTSISDIYQRMVEHRLARGVVHHLRHTHETPTATLMHAIEPYFEPAISTEAVLTLGKAIDLAHHGAAGILNVMPFSCMPGIITAGLAPRLRQDLDHIPWLDISYDLQKTTNIRTRLEAFMYQAAHYQRRRTLSAPAAVAAT